MTATIRVRRYSYSIKGCLSIISYLVIIGTNEKGSTAPLINNLKIIEIFKDKDKKEGASIMDLIY